MAWRDDKARATLIREATRSMQPGKTPRPFSPNRVNNSGDEPALATRDHPGLNKQLRPSVDPFRRYNDNDGEAACARGTRAPDQEQTHSRFPEVQGRQR